MIDANTFIYKPSRMGDEVEILGLPEIQSRWGIQRPEQVVDVLALMGDASDNIPGVPGIGEKTAMKLIGAVWHGGEPAGARGRVDRAGQGNPGNQPRAGAAVEAAGDDHLRRALSGRPGRLKVQPPDEEKLKGLLVEFEFNSIGRRLFGEDFKAGRGGGSPKSEVRSPKSAAAAPASQS